MPASTGIAPLFSFRLYHRKSSLFPLPALLSVFPVEYPCYTVLVTQSCHIFLCQYNRLVYLILSLSPSVHSIILYFIFSLFSLFSLCSSRHLVFHSFPFFPLVAYLIYVLLCRTLSVLAPTSLFNIPCLLIFICPPSFIIISHVSCFGFCSCHTRLVLSDAKVCCRA